MGGSSTSTQQVTVPPEVLARYNAVNTRAETTASKPFIPYSTDPNAFVAGLTPTQQAGIYGTNVGSTLAQPFYGQSINQLMGAQQAAVPFYGSAAQLNMQSAQAVNPQQLGGEQIGQYMSPYLGTVLQSTAALQNQMNQQAMSGQLGNAIRQGAFGGDRAGIAAANLAQQQRLADAKTFSDILNQGYGQALGTAQQQQQLGLSAAQANRAALQQAAQQQASLGQGLYGIGSGTSQQLAALGQGAQAAGLSGAQAQLAAGQAQQQTGQAGLTALYNQFLQQQSYPFQVDQFLANIAMGTGALSGSTTTTNQPGGLFSDRRLKENAQVIGKTFDGQPIYKFNYKGDDTTQIGLMAQNVEKRHPEAVGLAGGYKTVNYDKATRDAAERGHFASGGYASMGGGVMPSHAGEGFADGGYTGFDPMLMQQILANYQQMYAPMGGLGAAEGTISGVGRNIPMQAATQRGLMTAGDLPKQVSGIEQMKNLADTASEMKKFGSDVKDFFSKKKSEDEQTDDEEDTEEAARGGLIGYATGGAPLPYQKPMSGPGLDIPEEDPAKKSLQLQKAAQLSKPRSAVEDVKDIGKTIATVAALFSDKRLKENIKPIGKTFDGQTVYSYNYKGDKTTQIGLIAQEVARHHPKAVGHVGKYKTVNYDKATGLAAKRGHFAAGGDTEDEEEETPDLLDLDATLMKGIKPDPSKSFLQQLMEESEESSKEEPEAEGEAASAGAPAPVDAALNVANKAASGSTSEEPAAPAPSGGLLGKISKVEGTGKNPKSSAVGKYQIIDSTFVNYFRKLHPDEARNMSKSEILALRNSPRAKNLYEEMGPAITEDNKSKLRSMKLPVNDANVYALHFLGPVYGPKVITADAGTPVERLVPSNFISSNPSVLKGKTAGQVRDWLDRKMLATGGVASRHGYATDGTVEDEEDQDKVQNIVDKATEVADKAVGEPVNLIPANFGKIDTQAPTLTAAQAKPILEQALKTKTISPQDYANIYRSAGTAAPEMPRQMSDLGIGVENPPSAGLAPKGVSQVATQAVPEKEQVKKEGIGRRLLHPQGRTDYLIPLLTGVAGMIGAPTRNPFQAIAYGVGAGAMGLQKQREFDLQRQMVGVRSSEAAAKLMSNALQLYRPNPDPMTRDQYPWVDTSNRLITDAQRNKAVLGVVYTMGAVNPQFSNEAFKRLLTPEGGYEGATGVAAPGAPGAPTAPGVAPGAPTAKPAAPAVVKAPAAPKNIPAAVDARVKAGVYTIPQPTTPLDYAGLGDMDNPAKLRAFYQQNAGSSDPRIVERAKSYLDRANKIDTGEIPVMVAVSNPDGTTAMQAWNGWQQRKSDLQRYQSLRDAATKAANDTNSWSEVFSQNRDKVLNVFQKLAAASADANLNRGANYKANFIGYVQSIPGLSDIVPESFRRFQSAADEGDKYAAAQQIMVDVENKLTRAPAAGLQMAQRMAPGVTTAPSARYSYIVDNVAKILQDNAFNEFWNNNKNNIEDVSRARQDWYNQNPLSKYMRRAIDQTPFAQGMPQADRLKLISKKTQEAPIYKNGVKQMKDGKEVRGKVIVYYPTASQKASLPNGAYFVANGQFAIKGAKKRAQ